MTKKGSTAEKTNFSYRYINPLQKNLIDSNVQNQAIILHFNNLNEKLTKEIEKYQGTGKTGLFLQNAKTGAWLGINEKEGYNLASLLKIPIMMAVLKKVDREEIKLNDTIELTQEDLDKNAGNLYKKGAGFKITVWDLIKEMILSSDNTAKNALKRNLSDAEINAIFTHVGIPNPYNSNTEESVTPRGYIRMFKSLYYSTFLSPELSEKALDITTDTQVESLISAGAPSQIQVAHKYGERPDGISDCGIVYYDEDPYFLCVMTKDLELPKAIELIKKLSNLIYQFISSR